MRDRDSLSKARFWRVAAALLLLAAATRSFILAEFLQHHPAALLPWTDGQTYWAWAGRIAQGDWLPPTPFLSAPLYPLLLGVLRTLGAGLPGVYVMQLLIHLATAALLAHAARGRVGQRAALVSLALFLLLTEPAYSVTRPFANTLVLLAVVGVYALWLRAAAADRPTWGRTAPLGAAVGALVLCYPPAQLLVPLLAGHLAWRWRFSRQAIAHGAGAAAIALLVIAPVTLHNYRASGALIPVTAHAGVTMAQGNAPGSVGVYTRLPGVAIGRGDLHESAAAVYHQATGRRGDWGEVDRYFRGRAVGYLLEDPGRAAVLLARKAHFFFTAIHYDEMMPVSLDARHGLADMRWLAPLPTAWLFGLAAVGAVALARRRAGLVELLLAALPLVVVVIFFYSPRYRLPAAPLLCVLAGAGLVQLVGWRGIGRWLAIAAAVAPVGLTLVNAAVGFDRPGAMVASYEPVLAGSYHKHAVRALEAGRPKEAAAMAERSLAVRPSAAGHVAMARAMMALDQADAARAQLRKAAAIEPTGTAAWAYLYDLSLAVGDTAGAREAINRLLELRPEHEAVRRRARWLSDAGPTEADLLALAEGFAQAGNAQAAAHLRQLAQQAAAGERIDAPPPPLR